MTILNGADGLGDVAAGLVGQGMAILESVKAGIVASSSPAPAVSKPLAPVTQNSTREHAPTA